MSSDSNFRNIEFLDKNQTFTVISFADLNMLKRIEENINNHKK